MFRKGLIFCLSAFAVILISACHSAPKGEIVRDPQYVNMTGVWEFTYGPKCNLNGRMSLHQDGFNITGLTNNKMGDYNITGNISGTKLTLQGTDFNKGGSFICIAKMTGENTFVGDYTINDTKERILAKRAE